MLRGKKIEKLLEGIDAFCAANGIESMRLPFIPNVAPYCGRVLKEIVGQAEAKNVLEVGTAVGYSALWLASGLKGKGKIFSIEADRQMIAKAREFIEMADAIELVEIIEGNALEEIPRLEKSNIVFDVVFLDAAKSEYLGYFKPSEPMLRRGGYLAAHNVFSFASALKPFVDYLHSLGNFEVKLIQKADLLVARKL